MKRKDFLKGLGLVGVGTAVAGNEAIANTPLAKTTTLGDPQACVLIPSETAGPFPLDLTANTTYFRKDITEGKAGVTLNVKMKIMGQSNCLPMQNLRVNIWHCDKDGLYSGYDNNMNAGQAGKTYLRGYQMTDANGIVEFKTIFPGWYQGRLCHIHFQVYVSSIYAAISQLTFPITDKNAVYSKNSTIYTKGSDPLTFATDNIFSDGYIYQLATLTANAAGGYDTYLEVAISGSGITALAEAEPETGGQFKLGQNFPNPYSKVTTIPFTLRTQSDVKIDLFNLMGQKVSTIVQKDMGAGEQQIVVNTQSLGIAQGNYVYQLEVENANGVFRQCKMMTAAQ